ncbi:hypothetical protein OKW96_02070 [Sphingobacterium sp. KU25419]|nr:hypothetical protein OKW96_02070 [Sphingobacterium sp. KU25419]
MNTEVLETLLRLSSEKEVVEFKEAKNNYDFSKLGKYFSAISNEASLCGKPYGWLILESRIRSILLLGSNYRTNRGDLDKLKGEIANKTTNRITFIEIHEVIK